MKKPISKLIAGIASTLLLAGAARADSVTGNFTTLDDLQSGKLVPTQSAGQIVLTLTTSGTIHVDAYSYFGNIVGIGINTPAYVGNYRFRQGVDISYTGWYAAGGNYIDGFYCSDCGHIETFVLGTPGEFTSVWQILGGAAQYNFFMLSSGPYFANVTAVPEPASYLTLLTGLALMAWMRRRKTLR